MAVGAAVSLIYSLVLLNNDIGKNLDAVCLDGTPGAFYFAPAASPDAQTKWQIFFEGGGWCYDELDCATRAATTLGSSSSYAPQMDFSDGILSSDCSRNPDFCNYNKVYMKYCDGNSFSGSRVGPLPVSGGLVSPIYFRGHAILQATLYTLSSQYNLNLATHVHLSGCSAGGLSTFLHTNFVGDVLKSLAPNLQVYKSTPVSGFFLLHDNVLDQPVYGPQIQTTFQLSNASYGLDQDCINSLGADDQWKCNFAAYAYQHIRYPVFPLNSAYDSWQSACVFTAAPLDTRTNVNGNCSAIPEWNDCANDPRKCQNGQIYGVIEFETNFMSELVSRSSVFGRPGNGAFIHSCHTHCEALGWAYFSFAINGVTMATAVSQWWNSSDEPAANHTYYPCVHNLDGSNCNPTCGEGGPLVPRAVGQREIA